MDIPSYILGLIAGEKKGEGRLVIEGDVYMFTDPNHDGHIVVTKENDNG
jgi:hypothetical protein